MATTTPAAELWDRVRLNNLIPDKTFVEWTEEDLKEHVRFETIAEAELFYNAYSVGRGFAFRTHDTKPSPAKDVAYKRWVCCKAGKKADVPDDKRSRSERKITRTGCKADIAFTWNQKENCYRVTRYNPQHNHDYLSSREALTMPSNNRLTEEQRQQARELSHSGVRPAKIMSYMANGAGGYQNLGFKVRNLYNFMNSDINEQIRDGDAEAMLSYLASKVKGGDRNLFCKYTVDDENRLCHLFWADSRSRKDIHYYNDVVLFDATYKTNGYQFPLVLIIGVNNHGQTVLLGSCLMRDETTESYVWLLKSFMECMHIKEGPPLVLTDSDKAMIAAVAIVFSTSMHRCCSWHIQRNFQSYVASVGFKDVFMRCMTRINTEEDFQQVWHQGITDYGLKDNEWLKHMYAKRDLWAEYRFTPVFSAKQTTTSRSESINSFFKRFVATKQLKLYFFMINFDDGVQRLRENELEADGMNKTSIPPPVKSLSSVKGWVESAGQMYTRAVYHMVLEQIQLHVALIGNLKSESPEIQTAEYSVRLPGSSSPARTVLFDRLSHWAECSCGYMTECGIPCRHIFVAMKYEAVMDSIPEILVLKRWTMKARDVEMPPTYTFYQNEQDVDLRQHSRIGKMESLWVQVRDSASKTDEGYNEVVTALSKLRASCDEHARKSNSKPAQSGNASAGFSACSNIVRDPERVRTKGSAPETSKTKAKQSGTSTRHCKRCGEEGHDRRKCPMLDPSSQQQSQQQQHHQHHHQQQQHHYQQQYQSLHQQNWFEGSSSGFNLFGDDQNSQHGFNY